MTINTLRLMAATVGGTIATFVRPAIPYAALCTAMVALDVITAYALSRRVRRRYGTARAGLLRSRNLGRALLTLARIYALLLLATAVDALLMPSAGALRFCTGAVCFWQAISILENESSCSDAAWARIARRWLIDKARRHLQ